MEDLNDEKEKLLNSEEKDHLNLELNYIDENPFSNIMGKGASFFKNGFGIELLVTPFAFFVESNTAAITTSQILLGLGSSVGLSFMGIGLILGVSGMFGFLGYKIFSSSKYKKFQKFHEDLQNSKNMEEEKNIYYESFSRITKHISKYMQFENEKTKNKIEEILKKIIDIFFELESKSTNELIEEYKQKYSNITKFNILLVGKTGVGKSTLINGTLNLKKNKAIEGDDEIPQKIDGFSMVYPIDENDSDNLKGFYLRDTEGIEFSDENNNDIETHKKKIIEIIEKNISIPNSQINCIWYCLNGNRLENSDKNYITSLINSYNKEKTIEKIKASFCNYNIPIIFVFTQSYNSQFDNVEKMEKGLKKMEFFKAHPEEFNFIDVIAKEKQVKDRNTNHISTEKKYNIKKLLEESLKLGEKGMSLPLLLNSNTLYNLLYQKYKNMTNNIKEIVNELIKAILNSQNTDKTNIFNEVLPIFKNLIKRLCRENIDANTEKAIDENINEIIAIMKEMVDEQLNVGINYFEYNKDKFISQFEDFIKNEYQKKKEKNMSEKDFVNTCLDFIVKPISNNYIKFGILYIYNFVKSVIIGYSFEKFDENFKKEKENIKKIFEECCKENYETLVKNSKINHYA